MVAVVCVVRTTDDMSLAGINSVENLGMSIKQWRMFDRRGSERGINMPIHSHYQCKQACVVCWVMVGTVPKGRTYVYSETMILLDWGLNRTPHFCYYNMNTNVSSDYFRPDGHI